MTDDLSSDRFMAEYFGRITDLIDTFGWAVQLVAGSDREVGFAYTVGLFMKDLPEFVVFDVPPELSEPLLNRLAARAVAGVAFSGGRVLHDVVENVPFVVLEVIDTDEHLHVANKLSQAFNGRLVRAWQVVYPDFAKRWPWEEQSLYAGLPLLGVVPTLSE